MRALILGLGSMGKRRIRNLKYLGVDDITGYDTLPDRNEYARNTYGIETLDDLSWERVTAFDFVLLCTPPDLHMEGAIECARRGKHFGRTLLRGFVDWSQFCTKHIPTPKGLLLAWPNCATSTPWTLVFNRKMPWAS